MNFLIISDSLEKILIEKKIVYLKSFSEFNQRFFQVYKIENQRKSLNIFFPWDDAQKCKSKHTLFASIK